ncbi:MAG: glutaredoxin [Parcubacteria group bacterium Greene0714_7]|nr:MAG: glutaredoxin [Parcubacteria group bacterium Greene0714_7]
MKSVTIYSTPTCSYCRAAKAFFKDNNVTYQEKDVAGDVAARDEMIIKSHQMGVPVIDIDGSVTVGFDESRLREMLEIK